MTALLVAALQVAQPAPDPDEVKAGWVALVLFLVLAAVVAFLGFSLVKHLRRARVNFEHMEADGDQTPERREDPGEAGPRT